MNYQIQGMMEYVAIAIIPRRKQTTVVFARSVFASVFAMQHLTRGYLAITVDELVVLRKH